MGLFTLMLREEFRSQANRFGPARFAIFPLFIALSAGGAYWFVTLSGRSAAEIALGLHGMAFLFGLHTGTIGFIGRDALANLFGDRTLLVFSARTLPIPRWRLLGTFVCKELVSYSVIYIAPLVAALTPFWLSAGNPPGGLLVLWLSAIGAFALGAGLTLAAVGAYTRHRIGGLAATAGTGLALTWVHLETAVDLLAYTPLGLYQAPSLTSAMRGFAVIPIAFVIGAVLFRREALSKRRTTPDRFRALRRWIPGDERGLVVWTLFDVARSSGSVWKVAFTLGIVYAVAAFLVGQMPNLVRGVQPAPGITFGALLGMGSFGTYSWLTQFDGPETYLLYPLDVSSVIRAKFVAYVALSIPAGALYLAIAAVTFGPQSVLAGYLVFLGVAIYVFGLTAYLAGLAPNELLFDTPRFVRYGFGMIVVSVPLLVGALVYDQAPLAVTAGSIALATLAGGVGLWLTRRAGPRWDRKVRAGEN
jgi:hypothetical protein